MPILQETTIVDCDRRLIFLVVFVLRETILELVLLVTLSMTLVGVVFVPGVLLSALLFSSFKRCFVTNSARLIINLRFLFELCIVFAVCGFMVLKIFLRVYDVEFPRIPIKDVLLVRILDAIGCERLEEVVSVA